MAWPDPESPLPVGNRFQWASTDDYWFRIYHEDRFARGANIARTYGPQARFDHHQHTLAAPAIDTSGRSVIYVGANLYTAAAEVFRRDPALICPHFRVAQVSPVKDVLVQDLLGLGARLIDARPLLCDTEDYELSTKWARAIHQDHADIEGIRYSAAQGGGRESIVLWERAATLTVISDHPLAGPEMEDRIRTVLGRLGVRAKFIPERSCTRCLHAGTITDADFEPPDLSLP